MEWKGRREHQEIEWGKEGKNKEKRNEEWGREIDYASEKHAKVIGKWGVYLNNEVQRISL